ncbi:uncharacterized protein LOC128272905 [Anopheles cruzii]|uniref:uncharacterized protein LOC128272905 n=1 Tax=Anopheles cruzii TaxID=68878 RepID=UPI0022EC6D43|nr:uncharacterized protein LOC128272905 [Anopheles cruzii]
MARNNRNIVHLLVNREQGYRDYGFRSATGSSSSSESCFRQVAIELAELVLLAQMKNEDLCKPLDDLDNETESVLNIEQSHHGLFTATVQTNKSVNVFHTPSMRKIAKYHSGERSVWTLAFHPKNANTIAFATLGGAVSVYVDNQLVATRDETPTIGSLCFHPTRSYLLLNSMNQIIFWNWASDKTYSVDMYGDCKCRFLHMTLDLRLITGITPSLLYGSVNFLEDLRQVQPEHLAETFLRHVYFMLEKLEKALSFNNGHRLQKELNKQFYAWVRLLQTINTEGHNIRVRDTLEPAEKCIKSDLNLTLVTMIRRIEELQETFSLRPSVISLCSDDLLPLGYSMASLYTEPLYFFEKICQKYVYQDFNRYVQYKFDLSLVSEMLDKVFDMFRRITPIAVTKEEWERQRSFYVTQTTYVQPELNKHCALQAWDLDAFNGDVDDLPDFKEEWKNVITMGIVINDSNVDISQCEQLVASVRLRSVKEMEIRSLRRDSFGQLMFVFKFVTNFVSLSFSPSGRFVLLGLRCTKQLKYAYILDRQTGWRIDSTGVNGCLRAPDETIFPNERVGLQLCLPLNKDRYLEVNCIKWATLPGYGLLLGLKAKFVQICR